MQWLKCKFSKSDDIAFRHVDVSSIMLYSNYFWRQNNKTMKSRRYNGGNKDTFAVYTALGQQNTVKTIVVLELTHVSVDLYATDITGGY